MKLKQYFAGRELLLGAMVVAVAVAFRIGHPELLDPLNLADRSRYWVEIGLVAVPMTFIIASGGIDLSVGSLVALGGVAAGKLELAGWPLPAVIISSLLVGLAGGCFNAFAIQFFGLPPLVVTLATLALFRGLTYGITGAQPISAWPDSFTDWGSSGALHLGSSLQIPWSFIILLVVVVIGTVLFHRHLLGRRASQIGENAAAARFAGVNVARVTYAIYGFSGLMCGVAAITNTARFATAHPGATQGLELEAIAVVVLGGTRITGGAGSVPGTFLGLLLLGMLRYGLEMRGVDQQDQTILVGALLVVVALANEYWARRPSR